MATSINLDSNTQGKAAAVVNYLTAHGFSQAAACGIAGNIKCESSFNPSVEGWDVNGPSGGICQWHNSRLTDGKAWAAKNGKNWNSMSTQLDYLIYELSTKYQKLYTSLKTCGSAEAASEMWGAQFERFKGYNNYSGAEHMKRKAYSKCIFDGITTGHWSAVDINSITGDAGGGIYGGVDGAGPIVQQYYNVPRNEQEDNILFQDLAFCKKMLMAEIIDFMGISCMGSIRKIPEWLPWDKQMDFVRKNFKVENTKNYVKYMNNMSCDNSSLSEGIVISNFVNVLSGPYGMFGGGGGYTAFSDNFVASAIAGGNANGNAQQVCIALYNALIGGGLPWYVAVGICCNAHSRMTPKYSCIDTHESIWTTKDEGCWGIGFFGFLVTGKGSDGDKMLASAGKSSYAQSINTRIKNIQAQHHYDLPHDLYSQKTTEYPDTACPVPFNIQANTIVSLAKSGKLKSQLDAMKAAGFADCAAATLAVNKFTNPAATKNSIGYGQIHTRWAKNSKEICSWLGFSYKCFDAEITVIEDKGSKSYPSGSIVNPSTITSPNLKGSYKGSAEWQAGGGLFNGDVPNLGARPFAGKNGDQKKQMCGIAGLYYKTPKGSAEVPNNMLKAGLIMEVKLSTGTFKVNKYAAQDLMTIDKELRALPGWKGGICNCFRTYNSVGGGTSCHCTGLAVDVNPGKAGNPWFSKNITKGDWSYNNTGRPSWSMKSCPYNGPYDKNKCIWSWDHPVVKIFANHGWGWGGAYGDVMHFSLLTYNTKEGCLAGH